MRIDEDEKALEGLLEEPGAQLRPQPTRYGTILAAVVVTEIDGIERFPSAQKLCGYAGLCPSTHSSEENFFQGKLHDIATNGSAGPLSRRLGLPLVARPTSGTSTNASEPLVRSPARHPGHGAPDGSNHLAALDAAPGLHEPCPRPNTSEASLPSGSPAAVGLAKEVQKLLKNPSDLPEEDFPQPLQIILVGRKAEGFDDAPFNRMEGWGPDCH